MGVLNQVIPIYLVSLAFIPMFLFAPFFCPHLLGRYFNACNSIDNHNRMRQSDLSLDKYWVTQSGYFRLATTVALGMGIIDGNLLYYYGVAEGNNDKKISTLEYNNRTVYD